jgi:hypothetical protein
VFANRAILANGSAVPEERGTPSHRRVVAVLKSYGQSPSILGALDEGLGQVTVLRGVVIGLALVGLLGVGYLVGAGIVGAGDGGPEGAGSTTVPDTQGEEARGIPGPSGAKASSWATARTCPRSVIISGGTETPTSTSSTRRQGRCR